MGLILVGLGLNIKSISLEALENIKKCEEVYLESYTIDFPYEPKELEKFLNKKLFLLHRSDVEDESFLKNAKIRNVALLVYGDPFSATTHHQLFLSCKKQEISFSIFHNASIINSVAECGLSLYKFGKTCSMPKWIEKYRPTSFVDYIKQNQSIGAHTLLLVDIGLEFKEALKQLKFSFEEENLEPNKILVCSRIGTPEKEILYGELEDFKKVKKVKKPFCFILPSEMHFLEKELVIDTFTGQKSL